MSLFNLMRPRISALQRNVKGGSLGLVNLGHTRGLSDSTSLSGYKAWEKSRGDEAARRVLIIQAHPVRAGSFNSATADAVKNALEEAGAEVGRLNLYDMPDGRAFSPLLSEEERNTYFDENKQPQLTEDQHVVDIVAGLRWANSLILVYPTWWFNMPAMLKGFFDRCFVPGVGFRYDKALGKRTSGLAGIKRVGVVTSYGFDQPTIEAAGDGGRKQVEAMTKLLFDPEAKIQWDALYAMQGEQPPEQRAEFLKQLRDVYTKW
jgi:putative NADPH-quinone reductase